MKRLLSTALLALTASACLATKNGLEPVLRIPLGEPITTEQEKPTPEVSEPVLYARDGSIVAARPQGVVSQTAGVSRTLDGGEDSRMYLLELYQSAVEDRDALELEVEALQAEFGRLTREAEARDAELATRTDELAERDARIAELEAQSIELGRRLATAHLARLEAEKALLEARLAEPDGMLSSAGE